MGDWETRAQKEERVWLAMFTQYMEKRSTMTAANNPKLYAWMYYQRGQKFKGKLSVGREQKLNSIGFDCQTTPFATPDQKWLCMYHKLVAFYNENSHARVPYHYE